MLFDILKYREKLDYNNKIEADKTARQIAKNKRENVENSLFSNLFKGDEFLDDGIIRILSFSGIWGKSLQNLAQRNPGLNNKPYFVDHYRSNQKGINTAEFYKKIFDKYVTEKKYDLLTTIIFELNQSHELAVSSTITLDYDLDGNMINDYSQDDIIFGNRKLIVVSIFPEDKKTIILLSWLKDFDVIFEGYKKQLMELSQAKLMIYFNNFIPAYIENFFFSKRLFEKQTRYSQNKIVKAFKADFGNDCLDLRDEDDLRYLNYDDFRMKKMLVKPKYDFFK